MEALDAHFRGHFHASIYALYPSLVGIVADALVEHDATHSAYAKDEKKVEKFIAIARDRLPDSFAWRKILSAPLAFIQSGLFFKRFFDWGDPVNVTFPSRHALLHGKYDEAMFTEENSLKAILLLDSLINVLLATAPRESDVRADPGPGLAPDGPPTMEPPVAG